MAKKVKTEAKEKSVKTETRNERIQPELNIGLVGH